jgi:hypothetical protein
MQNLPQHLFVSHIDGSLYDTRNPKWSESPIRTNYRYTHGQCHSLSDVKASLRAGPFAWPGGYPLFLVTADSAVLCFDCARKEFRRIVWDWFNNASTGWRVIGCGVNYESNALFCDNCYQNIDPALRE